MPRSWKMAARDESSVLAHSRGGLLEVVLNRPRVLNTLNLEMVRRLRRVLDEALEEQGVRLVVLRGAGDRAFCAGGDLKELAGLLKEKAFPRADEFFREEYDLDLLIHRFPKPVVALADGITMGGGLGLAAGAALVVATERSRMALPETRIGFFTDVGATGWLFQRCPPGYPEYLALTGYEVVAGECVRLGLATHLVVSRLLPELRERLGRESGSLAPGKSLAVRQLEKLLGAGAEAPGPPNPWEDAWVAQHFAGKESLEEIVASLNECSPDLMACAQVGRRLAERSPTALALTLKLLRANQGRPLSEVFRREARAARFMARHPDYLEGIRARLLDKDDRPRWQPESIAALGPLEVEL